jgi:uncharacterized lipoprotein YbaY
MPHEIEVELRFPEPPEAPEPHGSATVYVRVEDVTEADAPAATVAEEVLRAVELPAGGGTLHAVVRIPEDRVQQNARYSVRVHVDADGDGKVSGGDWISTQSHPVLTRGQPRSATVPLKRV